MNPEIDKLRADLATALDVIRKCNECMNAETDGHPWPGEGIRALLTAYPIDDPHDYP